MVQGLEAWLICYVVEIYGTVNVYCGAFFDSHNVNKFDNVQMKRMYPEHCVFSTGCFEVYILNKSH